MSKSRDIADSAATINYIDNVTSDVQSQLDTLTTSVNNISVTSGTLTKTFTQDESSTINLTSSVLAPVVSVTKEVPQSGVTNNNWDVNSTTENYTRLNSAYATTLDFVGFDVSTAVFENVFSVAGQDNNPQGLTFNNNGTKMFVVGQTGDAVYEYTLSTAYDVANASYSQSFSIASQDGNPRGIRFNTDGTKMFVVGYAGRDVNEYSLSTGFDISTASFVDSFSVASQEIYPQDLAFNVDGTKMFVVGIQNDSVNEYTLSTGFDVSTASFVDSFSIAGQETNPNGLAFNPDGTKMFVTGSIGDDVNEYSLSTGFDVSTASYVRKFSVLSQDAAPVGIAFNAVGTKMVVLGSQGDDVNIYSLDLTLQLGTGSFASADVGKTIEANDGVFVLTATDGTAIETTAPTSYDQVASGSWEMYGVVYNSTDGDLELSGIDTTFDINTAVYSQNFSVSSQETFPEAIAFNTDGTKMFIVGSSGDDVNEYTLSTGFDVSTASYTRVYSVSAQDPNPTGIAFNANGTKMFIVGYYYDRVYEYNLSTGFNVSTASFANSFTISSQETTPRGIAFNTDGTKMFVIGNAGDDVNEYALSTAFDVSTSSFTDSFSISAQDSNPQDIAFNTNGTKMFIVGSEGDEIIQYTLSTGFDVSTASFVDSFSVASQDTSPTGIAFNTDGTKMFVVGVDNDDVYEYNLSGVAATPTGYHPVHTTNSTDTQYWTDINSMTADQAAGDGNVYYAISTDDRTTWTVIDNTDGERDIVRNNAGTWQYNSNATYASETWTNATTNTELAALAEAMSSAETGYGLANTSYDSSSFSFAAQETDPTDIKFNADGTKMYILGNANDSVFQYSLSTAYDISTASYDSVSFSVNQDAAPEGIAFNNDGTKMYMVGYNNTDSVYQYSLSTGFDLSTASYDSVSFNISSQDGVPRSVLFNSNGTKMYIVGTGGGSIYQYTLSTAFDLSTASYDSVSFSFSAQPGSPNGASFNNDGTALFVMGGTVVYKYTLSTGYDISTASYASSSFDTASQDGAMVALAFNANGTKMLTIGQAADSVYQYSTVADSANQMDKTQLDAVTDPNHITLGDDLDLAIVFNMTSGTTVPSSDGVAINYDANVLNKGAVLGTDYDFDAPAQDKVRITALNSGNFKVRVV